MGYIVVCHEKKNNSPEFFDVLSYGKINEMHPSRLLRRNMATVFESRDDAFKALEKTLKECEKDGSTWQNKFFFSLIKTEKHESHAD